VVSDETNDPLNCTKGVGRHGHNTVPSVHSDEMSVFLEALSNRIRLQNYEVWKHKLTSHKFTSVFPLSDFTILACERDYAQ
jgi:hypothetical protein